MVGLTALASLLTTASLSPVQAQLHTSPVPRGIDREVAVAAPPGGSALIYTVGLRGQSNPTKLDHIDIQISSLAAPLSAGLAQSDFVQLRLIESTNQTLGDGDDVLLNTVPAGSINIAGGTTTVSDGGNATVLGSHLSKDFRFRMYYIVADLAAGAGSGHAFRLGAVDNHITTSEPATIGNGITADNRDRVVVNQLLPAISVAPASLAFGSVAVHASSTLPLTVSNTGAAALVVTSVISSNGQFTRDIGSFTVAPGGSQVVNVTFTPTAAGVQSATLSLTHNAPTAGTVTTVAMAGTGLSPIIGVAPTTLAFGDVLLNTPSALAVTVSNTGTSDLTVTSITASDGQFVPTPTTFTVAPGGSQVVSVTYTPTSLGLRSATLSIVHNDQLTGSPSTVTMSGTGINPVISASPASLAFGTVQVGASSSLPLTVMNVGTSDLVVSGITSSDPAFSADVTSFTLTAGSSRVVNVIYAPTASGAQAGTLTLTHNAAGGTTAISLSGTGASAGFSVSPTSLAFGSVAVGASASLTLTVSNPGSSNLVVSSIASSDGQYVRDIGSFTVAPGGSQVVNVTFTPTATGSQPATLTITHNGPGSPTSVSLTGTGTSPNLSLSPSSLAYGSVVVGSSSFLPLTIINTGGASLTVSSVTASDGQFVPDATSFTIAAGNSRTINVTFTPSASGAQAGTLIITHNGAGSPATVPLSGTGTNPQIAVLPGSLIFGSVAVGASTSLSLTVTNAGDATLSITGTTSTDGQFTASPTSYAVAPGGSQTVTVTFAPTAAGAQSATLSLIHNATGSPTAVALSGTGTQVQCAVAPGSVDFGTVAVGSSTTQTVTVTNAGTAPLNVTSVSASNGQFVPSLTSLVVPAGGSASIGITFTPNAEGVRTGSLTLVHDAAGSPTTVALTGLATSPGFSLSPSSLSFGAIPLGSTSTLTLTVSNPGNGILAVSNIASSSGLFIPSLTSFTVAAGGSQAVTVTFTPDAAGVRTAWLTITHNASGSPGSVSMNGSGGTPGVYVSPDTLGFGNAVYGVPATRTLTVWNVGDAVLTVTDVSASDAEFTATPTAFTLAPGATQTVTVTFAASVMGSRSGVLFVSHDAAGGFTGIPVTASTTVDADRMSLNFGEVGAESDSTMSVTISNPSLAPVTITSVVSDNPVFIPDQTTFVIPAAGSQVVHVTFAPPRAGTYTGNLRVTHNPTVIIGLSGVAPGSTEAGASSSEKRRRMEVPFGGEALIVFTVGLYGLLRRGRGQAKRRVP